jgi:hypothetical protein
VGFEPTVRENRTPDFESGTFDHSATSPAALSDLHQAGRCSTKNESISKSSEVSKPQPAIIRK